MSGYKTYFVAAITAIYAVVGMLFFGLDQTQTFTLISMAAGMAGLRNGITK